MANKEEAAALLHAEIAKLSGENQQLIDDRRALIDEFVNAKGDDGPDILKKNLRSRTPDALTVIDHLLINAKSEAVRATLAKWIVESGLKPDDISADATAKELTQMLKELKVD